MMYLVVLHITITVYHLVLFQIMAADGYISYLHTFCLAYANKYIGTHLPIL